MRFSLQFVLLLSLCAASISFAQEALLETPAVTRARLELEKVKGLVASGVLPRARTSDAEDALADAEDDALIRAALYQKDITVEHADALVALTAKRVERRQKAVDARNKLLAEGIIARSEVADLQSGLTQSKNDFEWASTRARFAREQLEFAQNEQEIMRQMELAASSHSAIAGSGLVEHFVGSNRFDVAQFPSIEKAFETRFKHPLPVSAMGETEVHKSLGFDHRNRVDIALQPEMPEGQWLRTYLTRHDIPFFAFRSAVAHQATGAHIHIGPPSLHYVAQTSHSQPGT